MPSTSRIPLTNITGHELAQASEAASKYAATVIAFATKFTRADIERPHLRRKGSP
jgi:hypothetical protein